MDTHEELKIETVKTKPKDTNDYKELFGKLRTSMTTARDNYSISLAQVKIQIETKEEEIRILKIRARKLEGAIEANNISLVAVLPSNNKLNG